MTSENLPAGWDTYDRRHPPFLPGNELGFAPGNELSVTHGAYSRRKIDPRAAEIVDELLTNAGAADSTTWYLSEPSFARSVEAWAKAEAAAELVEEYLAAVGGPIDDEGNVRPAAEYLERVARRAERLRSRLGLDPLSRGQLARDLSAAKQVGDLARLKAIGANLLDADACTGDHNHKGETDE